MRSSDTNQKNSHTHDDRDMTPKYLTVKHYYVDRINHCRNNPNCQSIVPAENPSFSVREDQKIPSRLSKLLDASRTASTYSIRIDETQECGFAKIGTDNKHGNDQHSYEDSSSINSFEELIKNECSNLEKNTGCVFGHAEIIQSKCLISELEKMGIKHNLQKNEDVCVDVTGYISITIKGTKIVCSYNDRGVKVCKSVVVTSSKNVHPNILSADFEIHFEKSALKDRDSYDAKNIDGTYYTHDPIAIVHDLSFLWKETRSQTIQFETTKTYDLNKELEFDCTKNNCDYTVLFDGLFPTNHTLVNGQGMTMYNATIGEHLFYYTIIAKNLDRQISKATETADAQGVSYFPQYESYPYPLLKDIQEYTFDDRQAEQCIILEIIEMKPSTLKREARSMVFTIWA